MAALGLSLAALLVSMTGCADEQESLHEHDHFVPAHWPANLGHASQLIVARLPQAPEDEVARKELLDLMSWVPEIAADTELSEQQWDPIFAECEQFRGRLLRGFDNALETELQQLAEFLAATHTELEKLQPSSAPDQAFNGASESQESTSAEMVNEP
jgi:hypothetical protein